MKPHSSRLDLAKLATELLLVPRNLRAYETLEMSTRLAGGIPQWAQSGLAAQAVLEIVSITGRAPRHLMLNSLPAGVTIPTHVDREDAGPRGERWHLPVVTNPECFWWDGSAGEVHQAAGYWWGPCPNRIPHHVGNRGTSDRLHLIVDLA